MKKKLTRIMGDFIGEMDWNLFITLSYKNGCRENFNRRIMESYYQKNRNLINRMFFVSERNKNYIDVHSHFLISTNSVKKMVSKNRSLNKFGHILNLEINNNTFITDDGVLSVGHYVSKFYDKDVDWDIWV
jgi:hypothetical protein